MDLMSRREGRTLGLLGNNYIPLPLCGYTPNPLRFEDFLQGQFVGCEKFLNPLEFCLKIRT